MSPLFSCPSSSPSSSSGRVILLTHIQAPALCCTLLSAPCQLRARPRTLATTHRALCGPAGLRPPQATLPILARQPSSLRAVPQSPRPDLTSGPLHLWLPVPPSFSQTLRGSTHIFPGGTFSEKLSLSSLQNFIPPNISYPLFLPEFSPLAPKGLILVPLLLLHGSFRSIRGPCRLTLSCQAAHCRTSCLDQACAGSHSGALRGDWPRGLRSGEDRGADLAS